jgi:hypothetical protein
MQPDPQKRRLFARLRDHPSSSWVCSKGQVSLAQRWLGLRLREEISPEMDCLCSKSLGCRIVNHLDLIARTTTLIQCI